MGNTASQPKFQIPPVHPLVPGNYNCRSVQGSTGGDTGAAVPVVTSSREAVDLNCFIAVPELQLLGLIFPSLCW